MTTPKVGSQQYFAELTTVAEEVASLLWLRVQAGNFQNSDEANDAMRAYKQASSVRDIVQTRLMQMPLEAPVEDSDQEELTEPDE